MGLKNDAEEQITRKPKKDNKIQIHIQNQHQHINWKHKRRTAQTTNRQPRRNTNNKLKKIIDMAKKDLVYTKIKPPTNEERYKKNFYHKKCKSNIQDSF